MGAQVKRDVVRGKLALPGPVLRPIGVVTYSFIVIKT